MIAKPEKLSVIVFVISILFIALSMAISAADVVADLYDVVLPMLAVAGLLVGAELVTQRIGRFIAILLLHVAVLWPVLLRVGASHPLVAVMAAGSLILNISLRLPVSVAAPLNATVVVASAALTMLSGGSALAIAAQGGIEAAMAVLIEIIVLNRERLVERTRRLEEEHHSLQNLLAANEYFVRRLPEIKEESAEGERFRITRELHDSLGYSMTSIAMIMNAAQYLFEDNPQKVREYCRRAKEMALETMEETRRILYRLRALGRETPKQPAIFFTKMCRDFQEATGIQTECHSGNLTEELPERVFQAVFRTIQVGFINALKHGRASRIWLFFWVGTDGLTMTIRNSIENVDFDVDQLSEGIGLQGVRERIAELEGDMRMARTSDSFALTVVIPERELREHDSFPYHPE